MLSDASSRPPPYVQVGRLDRAAAALRRAPEDVQRITAQQCVGRIRLRAEAVVHQELEHVLARPAEHAREALNGLLADVRRHVRAVGVGPGVCANRSRQRVGEGRMSLKVTPFSAGPGLPPCCAKPAFAP